ncbi:unnamed protein product [Gadus morhua 'NCC']
MRPDGQRRNKNQSPWRRATLVTAPSAPLSPEMRPDGRCEQRRNKNQSPWRRAAHASATCASLTPEMCPDGRYGQRLNKNQSPRRRAAHASANVTSSQQGPISQKEDEPDTLIIGDSTIKDITAISRINVALSGTAIQSTTFLGGVAERAIDGNSDPHWEHNSCTHTNSTAKPWWRLELPGVYRVSEIQVTNRNTARERLNGVEVLIGNSMANNGNDNPR